MSTPLSGGTIVPTSTSNYDPKTGNLDAPPGVPINPTPQQLSNRTPVTSISTDQGMTALTKATTNATRLAGSTGPAPAPAAPSAPAEAPKPTSVTLINPATEQTVTFQDATLNKDNIQQYLSNGYSLSDASGQMPDWLTPSGTSGATALTGSNTPTGNADLDSANAAFAQAKSDLTGAIAKLTNFNVAGDPQLQTLLSGITSQWNTRIQQVTDAENSRLAALQSTGIRLGSQYTGGAGGMFGGIISAEEKKITNDIADLQTQKTQALAAAQNAYETQQWSRYSDLVNVAQKAYDSQLSQTAALQKAQAAQDQKIQDAATLSTRSYAVAKLMAGGTSDPAAILGQLKNAGDPTVTASDVSGILKDLTPAAAKGDTFNFSQPQMSQLLAGGMDPATIQTLHDYYNGKGDPAALANLTPEQQAAVHDALNGTAAKKAAATVPSYAQANPKTPTPKAGTKPYVSGQLTYTSSDLSGIQHKILSTKGADGYVDPYVYKDALDAFTGSGGLAKDFIKNFPPKNYINPAATWMPQYIQSKTSSSAAAASSAISNPFK